MTKSKKLGMTRGEWLAMAKDVRCAAMMGRGRWLATTI
jgi:hypothetical protein